MRPTALLPLLAATLLFAAPAAHALFKVVGPDGKVTYTDRPPGANEGRIQPITRDGGRASDAALPVALRQVVERFPVTLFTASDCGEACTLGRAFLANRGIPYTERIAENADDRDAWATLVGGIEAPTLKIGGQSLRGFAPSAWGDTLDVAGYPRQSLLPATYRPAPAIPLTERKPAPRAAPPAPPAPAPDSGSNPAGIRF